MNSPTTGRAVTEDGTTLAYQVSGTGPPLLLLAGQANNHHWWDRTRADHAGTTITLDWRGTGSSTGNLDTTWTTQLFAEDVVTVLDDLGLVSVDVYGTSMGGRVAQWLAIDHPERVRRLVLGCTTSGGEHAVERGNDIRLRLAGPTRAAVDEALADLMYTPAWRAQNPPPYTVLGDPTMSAPARRQHLRASDTHNAWSELPRISAPTLILHGTEDLMSPVANARVLAERITGSRVVLFPGARHAYFEECREQVRVLLDDHLA